MISLDGERVVEDIIELTCAKCPSGDGSTRLNGYVTAAQWTSLEGGQSGKEEDGKRRE